MLTNDEVPHPGARVKAEIIPPGMSITDAAKLIGVGRPALSNLLNGKASLSAEMAARLEKAFKFPRESLLEMQAQFDAAQAKKSHAPTNTKAYVPPFLGIKANQIETYFDRNITARTRLSVFLRTLAHSTGIRLTKVDFPGNDDAERPGWDGFIEAGEGTPWIPTGRSGWEFGVTEGVKAKADRDFKKGVKAIGISERKEITFVFVTPRHWPGKEAWVKEANAAGHWKAVRAFDSSDLEQWVEQSLPAQAWFANETNIPAHDVRSLDRCWTDWASVTSPRLLCELFDTAIEASKRKISSHFSTPPDGPLVIAADSAEEALAFLSQILSEKGGNELASYRDRVLIFDKPGVLPRLTQSTQNFIAVAYSREVERELAPYSKSIRSIVIYPRNAVNVEHHVILDPLSYNAFEKTLKEMGKNRDEIRRLADESGRSLTVLRRRLATIDAVRKPHWAADPKTAMSLVPFLFVGAWQSTNDSDRQALSLLGGERPYDDLEREFQILAQLNDAPVWSIGAHRGVISKIDLLHAIAGVITADDLKRYFEMAQLVLSEDDPALDLDPDQQWAASIFGKSREFSGAFRKGISETLVLLAVHGRPLFKRRPGLDPELLANQVVRSLLPTPLTTRKLEANDSDLPTYAEAAPDEFLRILEQDIKTENPAVFGLMRPMESGLFGRCPGRTGLLWALEGLSWNPQTLPRAAIILARLAQIEIGDNWHNKPINSLQSIFRCWMPQTAACLEDRVSIMRKLVEVFPDVAWKLCVSQFGFDHETGEYSFKPRWRTDGFGFGEPISSGEQINRFQCEMVEMALNWREQTLITLSDLIERLHGLDELFQARVWDLIETWARTKASDSDKAAMREKIRVTVLSRRAAAQIKKTGRGPTLTDKAKAAYDALAPSDLLNKHAWLFQNNWVEESAEEIETSESLDFQKRDERIQKMRVESLREIRDHRGLPAFLELATKGQGAFQIGFLASRSVLSEADLIALLRLALQLVMDGKTDISPIRSTITGAFRGIPSEDVCERVLMAVGAEFTEEGKAELLKLAPFNKGTWKLVDLLSDAAQTRYWSSVIPDWIDYSDAETHEGVERLLKADRPRAAFYCLRFHPEKLDAQALYRLLSAIAKGGNEKSDEYMLEQYNVERAFKYIDSSPDLPLEKKAHLEFAFLDALARPWDKRTGCYRIPNLERFIEAHPEVFVQALVWTYKRKDGGKDPAAFEVQEEHKTGMAERGHKLLRSIQRLPGHDELGELKTERLEKWVDSVRQASSELSRGDIADHCIGEIFANSPVGKDGVWPCEPVRHVMERIQSKAMMQGTHLGVYNSRGVHSRGEGGKEERGLAEKYRRWGQSLQISHPFVSSMLLMELSRTYEHEADDEDNRASISLRLP